MVGCRGRGALRRGLLGSVSTGLIHHAHCPVAVIHDKVPSSMQPVLVGIDGSPASELATAIAFDEASWRGVDLVPLHTWSDAEVSDVPSQEWSAQQAAAEEPLAERITGWQDRYPDVSVEGVVVWDQPARRLLDQSESTQLVIVGSHGRGGFTGMLLGSVSTAVVHGARIPVIVARQPSNCVYSDGVDPPASPCELSCSIMKLPQTPPLIRGVFGCRRGGRRRIHRSDRWRYRNRAAAVRVRSPPSPRYAHRVRNKVHRSTVRYRLYRIRELSCTSSMANGRRRCRQQVHVGQVHRIPYTAGTIGIDRQCWRRRGQRSGRVDHQMPMTLLTGGLRNRRLR